MRRIYALLLHLFPRSYRREYGEELQAVFNLSFDEASNSGTVAIMVMLVREFSSLPMAILTEHLRESRKAIMINKIDSRLNFSPGSLSELLAAFAPFFVISVLLFTIPLLIPYNPAEMPFWMEAILVLSRLSLLGFIFVLLVAGLSKGLPRWFLPYLGFVLSILNIWAFDALLDPKLDVFSFLSRAPQFIRNFAYQGILLMGILVLVILLVMFAILIPKFRPFYRRVRNDWTLLSFLIYGIAPFAILVTFDAYEKNGGPYRFGSFLILAIGGWFYLRSEAPWKKFLFLYLGMALSLAFAAVGRAILCENSLFDEWVFYCIWQNEMMDTMTLWIWLAIFIPFPLALNLLPRSINQLQTV